MNLNTKKWTQGPRAFRVVMPAWPVLGEVTALALAGVGRVLRMRRCA